MNKIVELDEAKATLDELIAGLKPDDEVVIVRDQQPVAKLVSSQSIPQPRVPGLMRGKLTVLAEDDEHLKDFEDYMP